MRLYSFINYYLSPLQQGLQTAHCVSELALINTDGKQMVFDLWAEKHKTIIICNGGNSLQLQELYEKLVPLCDHLALPLTKFNEDEQSLNGALTSVAVIVPEHFYDAQFVESGSYTFDFTFDFLKSRSLVYRPDSLEFEFIKLIKSYQLA